MKVSEVHVTQPFVNGVLVCAMQVFQEMYKLRVRTGSEKHWGESELIMYAERPVMGTWTKSDVTNVRSKRKRTWHRIPDAIVFSQGQNSQVKAFTPAAQSKQCCLTTEAKRVLDAAHLREALVECERNFGRQTDPAPRKVKPLGFSIVTDGVDWYFLQMKWTYTMNQEWKRCITISEKIDVTDSAELAKWLVFVFNCTITKTEDETGFEIVAGSDREHSVDILSYSTRSFTAEVVKLDGTQVVLKRWHRIQSRRKKSELYCEEELRYLKQLAGCSSICQLTDSIFELRTSIVIE